jgi:hypothetical protein
VGTIPSESFTILGSATTTTTTTSYGNYSCPPPQPGFHELHDFGPNVGSSGLAIDTAGKLYGTFPNGGSYGAGLLYELGQRAGHWFFSSLYSFLGGSNGGSPDGVMVGPEGVLYGAAPGGIQNCGSGGASYCGLIYQAEPAAAACATALCSWNETTIYQFTGNTDAWGGSVTAFDSAGNLYGSGAGGAYGAGAVFELSPSQAGWTERVLYSFTGGSNGAGAGSLLVGHDGNLYGTAGGGLYGYGLVFQLVPSGGGWTENVLYTFTDNSDGYSTGRLLQNGRGDLYGTSYCLNPSCQRPPSNGYGLIYQLSPSGDGWAFSVIYSSARDCAYHSNVIVALTIDAAGQLYAAEGGADPCGGRSGCSGTQPASTYYCGNIVQVGRGEPLVSGNADIFGNLASDAKGNLYGTTNACSFGTIWRSSGMIWQYSP